MLKQSTNLILALATVMFLVCPASAQKLYKWVDQQGNVTYQDQPPPKDANVLGEYLTPSGEGGEQTGTAPVTLYSVANCDACDLVRLLLQKNSVPFEEKNPSQDTAAANELKEKSGQVSVPSLTIGEKLLMGYNSLAIRDELKAAGYNVQPDTPPAPTEQTEGQPAAGEASQGEQGEPAPTAEAAPESAAPGAGQTPQ